jgi:hypothetical protein
MYTVVNSTSSASEVNGTERTGDNYGTNDLNGFYIGSNNSQLQQADIEIAEIIIRLAADDATTRSAIIADLEGKWGL